MKTHEEKIQLMYDEFPQKGIPKSSYAPPLYKLFWRIGIKTVPPIFSSYRKLFLIQATIFSVFWGGFTYLIIWRNHNTPILTMVLTTCFAGLLFGLITAIFPTKQAKKYNLPSWDEYGNS